MNDNEIILKEEYGKKLGMGPTAKKIFLKINDHEKVVLNFNGIEFMSRSFAQEYVFQRHNSPTQIVETNMSENIKQLLLIVEDDFKQTCLK